MIAVDCFSGCGGSACGLLISGFDVVLGIENNVEALGVYRSNHKHATSDIDLGNVELAVETIRSNVGRVPDLLAGSPPCQDFSSSGGRVEGERASLTVSFARIAVAIRPRCVLIENVDQMLLSDAYSDAKQMLFNEGYSILELRVNAAACNVPQVRRRAFVIAVLHCDPSLLRKVEQEASAYSRTPVTARTVRDCITTHAADTYFYPARNRHMRAVRSIDEPAPTLTTGCLASPPLKYTARHDDAGPLVDARVLSVADATAIASFPGHYFDGSNSRTVTGRFIGNAVPPAMMAVVARWCASLLESPVVNKCSGFKTINPRRCSRRSRIENLVERGLLDNGATLVSGVLHYVMCGGTGDIMVGQLLGWQPPCAWEVQIKERTNVSKSGGQAPMDDLLLFSPDVSQPFRSGRQAARWVEMQSKIIVDNRKWDATVMCYS